MFCACDCCLQISVMAQLPPKIPNLTPNFPDFRRQKMPSTSNAAATPHNPSWADEFLNFSAARRGFHRRSVSDSIAFLETPMLDQPLGSAAPPGPEGTNNMFDRFDDEQFSSMFRDEVPTALAPIEDDQPTSSDHNGIKDEKEAALDDEKHQLRNEPEEVQSQCKSETQKPINATINMSDDRITDPKRVKRILANRQSARRSRVKKLQYITELERSVTSLQAEVSMLSPRVAFLDQQRLLLNVDNSALKQRIAALSQDEIFKHAHQEALKREIERLGQLYHQQNHRMEYNAPSPLPAKEATSPADQKENVLYV